MTDKEVIMVGEGGGAVDSIPPEGEMTNVAEN